MRDDILNGVIKSVVFGVAVTWIAVFEGYDAPPTAEGVSRATTRTVVTSSLAILALDFVLTALMFTGGKCTDESLDHRPVGRRLRRRRLRRRCCSSRSRSATSPRSRPPRPTRCRPSSPTSAASRCAAPVKSAGVVVGRVAEIRFDNETYEAIVTLEPRRAPTSFRATPAPRSSPRASSASSTSAWRRAATA